MIEAPRIFSLGTIDASGVASMDIPWTVATPLGERSVLYLQGSVFAGNATVRTNSAFLLAR
jgi:hypothetical protein